MRKATFCGWLVWASVALAATPPALINYQGVLRDASGARLEGDFDMTFRFFDDPDPADPENEILVDSHTAAGFSAVTVTGGVFNTTLGGGTVTDGSGPGSYTDLSDMFGDFDPVYLEVQVGDEILGGRIRVVSSAYALNAHRLEDLTGGQLLRSDASDSFSTGTLATDPGTVLNVAGSFQLGSSEVTSDAAELNKLDGAGPTVSAANLTALTDGSVADVLHVHANTNAALLDGLDSTQFLRSDSAATFTGGTLSLDDGSTMDVLGNPANLTIAGVNLELSLGNDSSAQAIVPGSLRMGTADGDHSIHFYEGGPTGESLLWDDSEASFRLTNDLTFELSGSIPRGLRNSWDLEFFKGQTASGSWFRVWTDAFNASGPFEQLRILSGDEAAANFDGAVNADGLDYAEAFKVVDPTIEPGDVVTLMLEQPGYTSPLCVSRPGRWETARPRET
jgi:hypothetical protein